jgi:hypothetical protein
MTNAEHEDLVNAGRGHLSRYTTHPDADDIIEAIPPGNPDRGVCRGHTRQERTHYGALDLR